ncbi:MAG: hypothetical protein ACW98X_17780 [Promethearchaeota archaeon]
MNGRIDESRDIKEMTDFEFVSTIKDATVGLMEMISPEGKLQLPQKYWKQMVEEEIERRFGENAKTV